MLYQTTSEAIRDQLASNLRRLRVAHHMSLSELARSMAMSKATLSGIEHGRANPTVDTLAALANALRVSTAELLLPAPLGEVRIVRADDAGPTESERIGLRPLDAIELDGKIDLLQLALPARHAREEKPRQTDSRVHIFVAKGKLIAGPVDRISELAPGDYASFPADVPYLYETTRNPARALVLSYTPR